ncbi:hypothetical protein PBAL39_15434 [Pedobacter sp. BAL39]|uniref:hypothetical protein n=1 Tax=Pedobacter sp. BAL39 TaxID=391596 RepID=UPI0001559DB6|nr:hypothetical protein [Pedobacter sp. BAL39]EDM37830.1 hypothetical protein PBAL39_15434 [Pedobacter sp. BAL39]
MQKRSNDILRKKIYIIIFRSDTPAGKLFDMVLLVMILLSILSVFLESVASFRSLQYQPESYQLKWRERLTRLSAHAQSVIFPSTAPRIIFVHIVESR